MTFAIFRPSIYLVSVFAMMLVIGTGSAGVLNQTLSLGTLFIFITYISSFLIRSRSLQNSLVPCSPLSPPPENFLHFRRETGYCKTSAPGGSQHQRAHRIPSCMVRLREGRLYFKRHQFRHRTGRKSCICRCYRSRKIFHLKSDWTIL